MDTTQKRRMHMCAQLMDQEEDRALGVPRKRGRPPGAKKKVSPIKKKRLEREVAKSCEKISAEKRKSSLRSGTTPNVDTTIQAGSPSPYQRETNTFSTTSAVTPTQSPSLSK